jgi:competence protein ComEC
MNRWPVNKAYPWELAPFLRILLPFAAGILCYYKSWLAGLHGTSFAWLSIIAFLAFAPFAMVKTRKPAKVLTFLLANIFLFGAGVSMAFYNDATNRKDWFGSSIQIKGIYVARITATPNEKENSWKIPVDVVATISADGLTAVSGMALVYQEKGTLPIQFHKGDTILLPGKWQPLKDAGNPFEFSYATYSARNNILLQQWCADNEIKLYAAANPSAAPFTERAHDWCMAQLSSYLAGHKAMGLMQAMLLGDEVNLDEDLRQAYTNTGIIHIIAISGGNIAVFFIAIAFLMGWVKHRKHLWVKYAVALPIIWFYVLMAGAQPSAVRAAVMFSILAFGIMMQKTNNGINQLLATAFVLLCAEPAWLFSIGFQLSFVAVLSILVFYRRVYELIPVNKWKDAAKGPAKIVFHIMSMQWGVLSMSIAAEILIAPIVIYYFHLYPVMFAIANVAAFMFMSVTLLSGMALVLLSPLPFIAAPIASFIKILVDTFSIIVAFLQGAGPASFRFLVLTGFETVLFYIVIAGLASWLLLKQKRGLLTGLSAACILLLSFCSNEWNTLHQKKLVIYNVPHTNHIELLSGRNASVATTDPLLAEKIDYATRPAHTHWRTWALQQQSSQEAFIINGKSLLLLNDKILAEQSFHTDYLVLNCHAKVNISYLVKKFSPSTIIVGNTYTKRRVDNIVRDCKLAGIAVHVTETDGAFVLSN